MFLQHNKYDQPKTYTEAIEAAVIDIDNFHEAALSSAAEMEYNYNSIMEVMCMQELTSLKDNKEVKVAKDTLKRFWDRVKKFFMSAWAKVKGLYKKFVVFIEGHLKKTDAFFKKYEKEITKKLNEVDLAAIKFSGYEFHKGGEISIDAILQGGGLPGVGSIANLPDNEIENANRDSEATLEKMRAVAVKLAGGSNSAPSGSELNKELFKAFRNGESSKKEIRPTAQVINSCAYSKEGVASIKKSYEKMEQNVNEVIKKAEAESKSPSEDAKTQSKVNIYINFVRKALAIANVYCGAQQTAIKDEANQCQKFASQILRAPSKKAEKKEVKESADLDDGVFSKIIFR